MSRYIDADAIKEKSWQAESEACFYTLEDVVSVTDIDEAPSIDIVRCKECKHWTNGDDVYGICYRCPNTRQMRYDDFCSYGEVRDE